MLFCARAFILHARTFLRAYLLRARTFVLPARAFILRALFWPPAPPQPYAATANSAASAAECAVARALFHARALFYFGGFCFERLLFWACCLGLFGDRVSPKVTLVVAYYVLLVFRRLSFVMSNFFVFDYSVDIIPWSGICFPRGRMRGDVLTFVCILWVSLFFFFVVDLLIPICSGFFICLFFRNFIWFASIIFLIPSGFLKNFLTSVLTFSIELLLKCFNTVFLEKTSE